jgi:hypothetical protein
MIIIEEYYFDIK